MSKILNGGVCLISASQVLSGPQCPCQPDRNRTRIGTHTNPTEDDNSDMLAVSSVYWQCNVPTLSVVCYDNTTIRIVGALGKFVKRLLPPTLSSSECVPEEPLR